MKNIKEQYEDGIKQNPYFNEFKEMVTGDRSVGIFPFELEEARDSLIEESYIQNKKDVCKYYEDVKEIIIVYDFFRIIEERFIAAEVKP